MEKIENNSESNSSRDLEFANFLDNLDISNPTEEQKELVQVFISEKPLYAEMVMGNVLMEGTIEGGLHSFGKIAQMCIQLGIEKSQMQKFMSDKLENYWDEAEGQTKV